MPTAGVENGGGKDRAPAGGVRVITPLRRTWRIDGASADCCCPSAAGSCRPPYDLQPASLTREPQPLDVVQEAAAVLSGSILEQLRAGRVPAATQQLNHLGSLIELVTPEGR